MVIGVAAIAMQKKGYLICNDTKNPDESGVGNGKGA
jgi:hypothetical protein